MNRTTKKIAKKVRKKPTNIRTNNTDETTTTSTKRTTKNINILTNTKRTKGTNNRTTQIPDKKNIQKINTQRIRPTRPSEITLESTTVILTTERASNIQTTMTTFTTRNESVNRLTTSAGNMIENKRDEEEYQALIQDIFLILGKHTLIIIWKKLSSKLNCSCKP